MSNNAITGLKDYKIAFAEGIAGALFVWCVPPYVTADMMEIEQAFEDPCGAIPRRLGISWQSARQTSPLNDYGLMIALRGAAYDCQTRSASYRKQIRGELPVLIKVDAIGGHIFWGQPLWSVVPQLQAADVTVLMPIAPVESE